MSILGILFHFECYTYLGAVFGILINESNKCGGVPLFFNWVQNQLDIRQCYYQLISWSFFIKGSRCLQRDLQRKSNLMNTVELKPKITPMIGPSKTTTWLTVRHLYLEDTYNIGTCKPFCSKNSRWIEQKGQWPGHRGSTPAFTQKNDFIKLFCQKSWDWDWREKII